MSGIYQFLWSASLYIALIGLFFISLRWLMNKLKCQQTSIYQLWFIFPLGFLLLLVFQLTNVQMTDVSQIDFLVMPTIQVSAQNVSNIVSLSELTIMTWIIIASLLIIRLVYQYLTFKQALKLDVDVISKNVHESDFVTSPMAFGMIKPCVYLPKKYSYELDKQQKLLLIEHELIHCKRYDPMLRMLYKILTIIFWFHPVIYIINRMLKHDQETSVDQLVLTNPNNKTQKLEYSKLLFQVSQNIKRQVSGKIPEIYCSSNSMLKERIMLIKNNESSKNNIKSKLISIVLITSAITTTVVTTSSLANNGDNSTSDRLVIPQPPRVKHDHINPPAPPNVNHDQINTPPPPPPPSKVSHDHINTSTPPKHVKPPKVYQAHLQEKDLKIIPIKTVAPKYPYKAAKDKIEGFVTFELDITTQGSVLDVRVIESVPEGVFDKAATKSVKQFEFTPVSQPVTITQKIEFKLAGTAKAGYGVAK